MSARARVGGYRREDAPPHTWKNGICVDCRIRIDWPGARYPCSATSERTKRIARERYHARVAARRSRGA